MHHIGLTLFHDKNSKNFLGRGTSPSPEPSGEGAQPPSQTTRPVESEHPLPTLHPLGAYGASNLAPTALDTPLS